MSPTISAICRFPNFEGSPGGLDGGTKSMKSNRGMPYDVFAIKATDTDAAANANICTPASLDMSSKTDGMLRAFFSGGSIIFLIWLVDDSIPEAVGSAVILGFGSISAALYAIWADRKNAE